jgi:crotonobetainyl-CoA:carnitine CoA-transferase CaiB-like acyl-CoA transferase
LFENNAFLMAQAILGEFFTGEKSVPWSVKKPPWPVYDLFDTADGTKLFVAIVGDGQWDDFCREFGRPDWLEDKRLQSMSDRADARPWLIPEIQAILGQHKLADLVATFERLGLPFAPVRAPGELLDDPHLNESGGLLDIVMNDGRKARIPGLPFTLDGERLGKRSDPPRIGGDTRDVLTRFGLEAGEIDALLTDGVVGQDVSTSQPRPRKAAQVD